MAARDPAAVEPPGAQRRLAAAQRQALPRPQTAGDVEEAGVGVVRHDERWDRRGARAGVGGPRGDTTASRFRVLRSPIFYAAAAGLVFMVTSLVVWMGRERVTDPGGDDRIVIDDTAPELESDAELIANLDLLADSVWPDPGEHLSLLLAYSVDVDTEELLEYQEEQSR